MTKKIYDKLEPETFRLVGCRFDVQMAKILLNTTPHQLRNVDIDYKMFGGKPDEDGFSKGIGIYHVDWKRVKEDETIDKRIPVIIATLGDGCGHCIIDGSHRIGRALEDGDTQIFGCTLTEEETDQISPDWAESKENAQKKRAIA